MAIIQLNAKTVAAQASDARATVGRRFAVLGDSISATAYSINPPQFSARGYIAWLQVLMKNRIETNNALNHGVAGETSTQVLARLQNVIAAKPHWCAVLAGTNDTGTSDPATSAAAGAVTVSNLKSMLPQLGAAGIRPVWIPILPRTSGATNRYQIARVNAEVQRWCRQNGIVVANCTPFMIDSSGQPLAGVTYDGLHPNVYGAYLMASIIKATLDPFLPLDNNLTADALDVFDATMNPWGNMTGNALMTGTTGSLVSGMTGSVATGITMGRLGGSGVWTGAVAASKEASADNIGEWQRFDFTGFQTAFNNEVWNVQRQLTLTSSNVTAGDVVEAFVEFEVLSNTIGLNGINLILDEYDGSGSAVSASALSGQGPTDRMPAGTLWSGVLRTPPYTVRPQGGGSTRQFVLRATIGVDGTVSGGATFAVRFRRINVRKVPS
jgi:lysophospholipase L1-like esterase